MTAVATSHVSNDHAVDVALSAVVNTHDAGVVTMTTESRDGSRILRKGGAGPSRSLLLPLSLSSSPLPLEVRPLNQLEGLGSAVSSPVGSGAELAEDEFGAL